jgi:hypothetical protein
MMRYGARKIAIFMHFSLFWTVLTQFAPWSEPSLVVSLDMGTDIGPKIIFNIFYMYFWQKIGYISFDKGHSFRIFFLDLGWSRTLQKIVACHHLLAQTLTLKTARSGSF